LFSGDSKQVTVRQPGPDLRTRIHDLPSLAVLTEADSVAFAERELVREFDDPTSKHTIAVHFGKTRLKSLTDIEDVDVATLRGTAPRRSFNKTASTAGAVVDSVLRFGHTSTADFSNIFLPEKADLFEEEQIIESISAFTSTPERTDSLLQRMELSTRDLERVLSSKERHVGDVARLIDVLDNEFVISNPRSGAFELQQGSADSRDSGFILDCVWQTASNDFYCSGRTFRPSPHQRPNHRHCECSIRGRRE
jgi:hypothetical protein